MNKNVTILIAGVVGFGAGYFTAVQRTAQVQYNRAEEEIEHAKEYYANKALQDIERAHSIVAAEINEKITEEQGYIQESEDIEREHRKNNPPATMTTDYRGISARAKKYSASKVSEQLSVMDEELDAVHEEPYLMTQAEYEESDADEASLYDHCTLVYYILDGILTDHNDKTLDVRKTLGSNFGPEWFGDRSSDENTCHVSNPNAKINFEVVRSVGSFSKEVLGVEKE